MKYTSCVLCIPQHRSLMAWHCCSHWTRYSSKHLKTWVSKSWRRFSSCWAMKIWRLLLSLLCLTDTRMTPSRQWGDSAVEPGENTPTSHQVTSNHRVPHYRNFLKGSANSKALTEFVSESVATKAPARLPDIKVIVLAGGCWLQCCEVCYLRGDSCHRGHVFNSRRGGYETGVPSHWPLEDLPMDHCSLQQHWHTSHSPLLSVQRSASRKSLHACWSPRQSNYMKALHHNPHHCHMSWVSVCAIAFPQSMLWCDVIPRVLSSGLVSARHSLSWLGMWTTFMSCPSLACPPWLSSRLSTLPGISFCCCIAKQVRGANHWMIWGTYWLQQQTGMQWCYPQLRIPSSSTSWGPSEWQFGWLVEEARKRQIRSLCKEERNLFTLTLQALPYS